MTSRYIEVCIQDLVWNISLRFTEGVLEFIQMYVFHPPTEGK